MKSSDAAVGTRCDFAKGRYVRQFAGLLKAARVQLGSQLLLDNRPEPYRFIGGGGGNHCAVWAEGYVGNWFCVAGEGSRSVPSATRQSLMSVVGAAGQK